MKYPHKILYGWQYIPWQEGFYLTAACKGCKKTEQRFFRTELIDSHDHDREAFAASEESEILALFSCKAESQMVSIGELPTIT